VATWLATNYGLHTVGWYLSAASVISLVALVLTAPAPGSSPATAR
jgi:hypothetical protein